MDSGLGGCGTRCDLRVAQYVRCLNRVVNRRWWLSGTHRFQALNLVHLCNKSCHFIIFAGQTAVTEVLSDPDDLFDVPDVLFSMIDSVADLGMAATMARLASMLSVNGTA